MLSWDLDADKKKRLIRSMIALAVIAVGAGVATNLIAQQFRMGDPLYQCIESDNLPYRAFVNLSINIDGRPMEVPAGIGITDDCVRPIHTRDNSGLVRVVYYEPFDFTLGHFLWYWNFNIREYDATVFVNGVQQEQFLDIALRDGMSIHIDFKSKSSPIV